ncbi:17750_t:CDS:2 [Cetraspora pellucida]|uniref:17750_t:CDS:1 n=1 Tax=Cetraspora pellucida TaxID=1433469 RepID=A0A9N9A291_9GLOM|nr:17750_t:CDS:2 [Cetraspora pellucida]
MQIPGHLHRIPVILGKNQIGDKTLAIDETYDGLTKPMTNGRNL